MYIRGKRLAWLAPLVLPLVCQALPLSEYGSAASGNTLELYVAGSSAQDSALQRLLRLICEPNSLDVFRSKGNEVRLFFCRTRAGREAVPGIDPGQKIAFHKSSIGGSGSGVGPLILRTPVEFLNVTDLRSHMDERCPLQNRTHYPAEGGLGGYTDYECANPSPDHQIPDAGISDVEPRFFLNAYRLAPEAVDALSVHNANAFIFGIPVNLALRNALQAARFVADDPCHPSNPHYRDQIPSGHGSIPRGESEACMPSLSRAQLAGIFSGRVTKWSQIVNQFGYPLAVRDAHSGRLLSPPSVQPPSEERVYVCRRVNTSGTQAAFEMFFLNQRCTTGVSSFVDSGNNIFQGSVTGDVEGCLTQLDRQNAWAVGIMTTDTVESIRTDRWRFIKMDGVAPTLLNTYNGYWPFFVEQSYQWRNERSEQPLQGPKLALMAQIGLQLGNPAVIRDLNRGFRHVWGDAGIMALSDANLGPPPLAAPGKPVDQEALENNPTLAVRHDSNNCSAVVSEYPTALP